MSGSRMVVLSLVLCSLTPALADAQTARTRVGLAASVSSGTGVVAPEFLVPIDVVPTMRIEPEIGYTSTSYHQTVPVTSVLPPTNLPIPLPTSQTNDQTTAALTLGTGVFYQHTRDRLRLQYGGRFGYVRSTSNDTSTTTLTSGPDRLQTSSSRQSGYFVGPAIGGEYLIADRFSIGAELHLRYTSSDLHETITSVPSPNPIPAPPTSSQSSWQTRASIAVRIYVW